jgi:hypothetical protein
VLGQSKYAANYNIQREIAAQGMPDSNSYIEKIDISDGSAQMMGMETGQSFYKLANRSSKSPNRGHTANYSANGPQSNSDKF